jgi:hypothetical protein
VGTAPSPAHLKPGRDSEAADAERAGWAGLAPECVRACVRACGAVPACVRSFVRAGVTRKNARTGAAQAAARRLTVMVVLRQQTRTSHHHDESAEARASFKLARPERARQRASMLMPYGEAQRDEAADGDAAARTAQGV